MCDGDFLNVFGRRNVDARDAQFHCCTTDLCNVPQQTTTTSTTQGLRTYNLSRSDNNYQTILCILRTVLTCYNGTSRSVSLR